MRSIERRAAGEPKGARPRASSETLGRGAGALSPRAARGRGRRGRGDLRAELGDGGGGLADDGGADGGHGVAVVGAAAGEEHVEDDAEQARCRCGCRRSSGSGAAPGDDVERGSRRWRLSWSGCSRRRLARRRGPLLERPKSSTFGRSARSRPARRVTKRLPGLMSRWTMPRACASARASQASRTMSTASTMGSLPRALKRTPRSLPGEVLHHHVGVAALERADVEHAGHVLALDGGGGLGLAEEAGRGLGQLHRGGEEELDGHPLLERQVLGGDDDPHPPVPEHPLHLVLAGDHGAGLGGRLGGGERWSDIERGDDSRRPRRASRG